MHSARRFHVSFICPHTHWVCASTFTQRKRPSLHWMDVRALPDVCSVRPPPQSGQDLSPRALVPPGSALLHLWLLRAAGQDLSPRAPVPPGSALLRLWLLGAAGSFCLRAFAFSETLCERALLQRASSGSGRSPSSARLRITHVTVCITCSFFLPSVSPWGGRVSVPLQLMCSLFLRLSD